MKHKRQKRDQRHRYYIVKKKKNRIPFYFCIRYNSSNLGYWRIHFYKIKEL